MGDDGSVARLQTALQHIGQVCANVQGATKALNALLGEPKGVGQGSERGGKDSRMDTLVRRAESATKVLREKDAEFQKLLSEALSGGGDFKARKLKSDYERRLNVAQVLKNATAVLKRARFAAVEARKLADLELKRAKEKEQSRLSLQLSEDPLSPPPLGDLTLKESQVTYALREYDQASTLEQEKQELRAVAKNAALVQEMAVEVGSLLAVQEEDVEQLEKNTEESVVRAMEGVHELGRYKRKQANTGATKATLGTATVGGLVGIVGGPVGMAIGAGVGGLVGMVAGKGVASVKRRSINAEMRRVKALLAAKKQRKGEFILHILAYETQAWSYIQRKWFPYSESKRWTDEYGEACTGAHPGNDMSAIEARMLDLAMMRSANLEPEEEDEIARVHAKEVRQNVVWSWASPQWEIVMERKGTDLGGWDFGSALSTDSWHDQATRGDIVRRRLWSRCLVGQPTKKENVNQQPPGQTQAEKDSLLRNTTSRAKAKGDSEVQSLWDDIHRNTSTTNEALKTANIYVTEQGESIAKAERNATVVGDAAVYSERIARASYLSGAIRNMVSMSSGGQLSNVDKANKELEHRRQLAAKEEEAAAAKREQQRQFQQDLDTSDFAVLAAEENRKLATSMANELEIQNDQLDRTAAAVERGNEGMLRITKRIK